MYEDAGGQIAELRIGEVFPLGKLILASQLPSRVVYQVRADQVRPELLQYEGVWPVSTRREGAAWTNAAHFTKLRVLGPGQYAEGDEEVTIPLDSNSLVTLFRFFGG